MATDMDDDEDDFVTIGIAFDIPEEPTAIKRPSTVHEQTAVDEKGRRRFHGAFTGGFSAGYFNSVGTKEGWSPSTFVSSRSNRKSKENAVQRPEDFMDDEDFSEYGIAPKKFMTKDNFTPQDREASSLKRSLDQAVKEGALKSAVPGGLLVDDLVVASKSSIGIVLLRKMGWKEGQGIGDKIKTVGVASSKSEARKIYGCSLPSVASSTAETDLDIDNLKLFLAPKDVQPISFDAKNNTHGIGYSGIDPNKAMFLGAGSLAESFKPSGTEKRGIRGQAFGIGAFEDEDDDIYTKDFMSNYDFSMASEAEIDKYANHGWSGPSKRNKQKGVLVGFQNASKAAAINKIFPAPSLPSNYKPKHSFDKASTRPQVQKISSGCNSNTNFLSAKDRAIILGEKEPKKTVESVFDVISDEDKDRMQAIKETLVEKSGQSDNTELGKSDGRIQPEKPRKVSRWDSKVKKTIAYASGGVEGDSFKPFANDPEKQERYNEFLSSKQFGKKIEVSYKSANMTEWEKEREKEEFSRAAILFRPMSTTIASRFTRATQNTDEKTDDDKNTVNKTDCEKAASLGLFGKLTRKTYDWHPNAVLCKRFNIPDPYPGSRVMGIPGNARRKGWLEGFNEEFKSDIHIEDDERSQSEDSKLEEGEDTLYEARDVKAHDDKIERDIPCIKDEDTFPFKAPLQRKQQKTIKIGPLSYLNDSIEKPGKGKLAMDEDSRQEPVSQTIKPSMDLFKAIFADSDSSSDDEENVTDDQKENENTGETKDIDNLDFNSSSKSQSQIENQSQETVESDKTLVTSYGNSGTSEFGKTSAKSYDTPQSSKTPMESYRNSGASEFDKTSMKPYMSEPDKTPMKSYGHSSTSEFDKTSMKPYGTSESHKNPMSLYGQTKYDETKHTSQVLKSSRTTQSSVDRDSLSFGPALPGEMRLSGKCHDFVDTSQYSRATETSAKATEVDSKSLKKHKKDKQKSKKHKHKQKTKKNKRKSEKKSRLSKRDYSDTESTDSDQEMSDPPISDDFRSNNRIKESNHKSQRSVNHSKDKATEQDSESHKSRKKKKSKKNESKIKKRYSSDESEDSERESSSKSKKKEDALPSARALVEKMKKHGLVIKRKSAADYM